MRAGLIPRPAATVMVLRDADKGCEILMLRRNLQSDFVGGAYVFPGGALDDDDASVEIQSRARGRSDDEASARLGLPGGALSYYVACLRELFEEAGILLARSADGSLVRLDDPVTAQRFVAYRDDVHDHRLRFVDVLKRENLLLDLASLEYVAHWVTPEGPPRRYDTRFFVALCPPGQLASNDAHETVAEEWLRPRDALERHARGDFTMLFPTISTLREIADFTSASDVLDYARNKPLVARVQPRLVERDGQLVAEIPDDSSSTESNERTDS